ncbi:MAG: hypothetical protein PHV59_12415 [Victivallales bacterium]|nr:hypothetical protein [Victivallales bacterium]
MLTEATIKNIASSTPTPFYVYDAGQIRRNIRKIRSAFPETITHFSLKSNPCPGLCRLIAETGIEAEVASPFEARIAVRSGFNPAAVMYDGPGKTPDNIIQVLKLGIRHFNIEAMSELERLQALSANGVKMDDLRLCLRINPREACEAAEKMTGKPSRFGIDLEELPACLDRAAANNRRINGIHLYLGSQILSEDQLIANYRTGLDIIERYYDKFRFHGSIEYVFGAGFGIPYQDTETELDLKLLAENFARIRGRYRWGNKIISRFELGRYLTANAGKYVAGVIDVKISRGEKFVTLDGGINHFLRYTLTGAHHRVSLIKPHPESPQSAKVTETAEICGPTCTPYDITAKTELPWDIAAGDIVVIHDAGAYGWSMGMQNFLSFPSCAELIFDAGEFHCVRRRQDFADLLALCET